MAQFEAYHGTSNDAAISIREEGFLMSKSEGEWLGDGVYFFLGGISDPKEDAEGWAICNSWDNKTKRNKYEIFAVIESILRVEDDNLIDLDNVDDLCFFNEFRESFNEKIRRAGKNYGKYADGYVLNEMSNVDVKVVKARKYVKLKPDDRILDIRGSAPNCTICSVRDSNCITNTRIVKTGRVV